MSGFPKSYTRLFWIYFYAFLALGACVMPVYAEDPKQAAIFPFELILEQQMDGNFLPPTASDKEKKRLKLMDRKLQELLESSGNFSRVDLSTYSEKIEKASPIHDCKGCELDFAKQAGANVAIVGLVRKATNALINISIFIRDVKSGKLLKGGVVIIREDNDAGWVRAVRYIVRNKLLMRSR